LTATFLDRDRDSDGHRDWGRDLHNDCCDTGDLCRYREHAACRDGEIAIRRSGAHRDRDRHLGIDPLWVGNPLSTFVAKGSSLAAGAKAITATFAGSGNFANSAGTVVVTVTAPSSAANVVVTATPKTSSGWPVALQLQETAGVATKVTGFSINGTDFSSVIANAFGGTQLPANGTLSASLSIQ
jgi:hypothetical protein